MAVILLAILAAGFALWRFGRRLRFFLHMLQLEGYKATGMLLWAARRPFDVVFRRSHLLGILVVLGLLTSLLTGVPGRAAALVLWILAFASSRRYRRDRPKKSLVWTSRMKRIGAIALLLGCACLSAFVALSAGLDSSARLGWILSGFLVMDLAAPIWTALAVWLLEPLERRFREGFKESARSKLAAHPGLRIVAITGSYGKTSVKFAVAEVLRQRYSVLATPGSYNTPMGICTVVNRDLRPWHQVLILEMGIRHPGDIEELLGIARPDVAVITGVGVAHMETMGTIEAIAEEKGSILEGLSPDGHAVINLDDAFAPQFIKRSPAPVTTVSADSSPASRPDLTAESITFDSGGTEFRVASSKGESAHVHSRLLGRHHVMNQLLALAVAQIMGIRLRTGARALKAIEPVPHRLSLRTERGLTILDDAFNSNPVGAVNALEVLGQFTDGRRAVVTPGMVELGAREEAENEAFGRAMNGRIDLAVLVGQKRTAPIRRGLLETGFPASDIHVVGSFFEAQSLLTRLLSEGDTVLYENDLPDQYTETKRK